MLYIAGGDHLPVKFAPSRQLIGPRPPVPPMPTANFFTRGITMTQSALASAPAGTSLLPIIAVSTVVALRMVSSSSDLLAAHKVRVPRTSVSDASTQIIILLLRSIAMLPPLLANSLGILS